MIPDAPMEGSARSTHHDLVRVRRELEGTMSAAGEVVAAAAVAAEAMDMWESAARLSQAAMRRTGSAPQVI
ncbi:hypothetical protein [Sorangium atrum]|uniref:Uncharacterized protein n=1 Tax=Sorangium atrum TaxID=2995308 RepID=A0ABT5BXS8_9BACT|nr:hypothetical protein [Sorangium aterium]MDC0678344.1 hypothetical protein [Sorangium aterium]